MNTLQDVNNVREAIAKTEGVVACEINKDKGEVSIVYDVYFANLDNIIESIEELGYTVI
jgi:Copper chaperone